MTRKGVSIIKNLFISKLKRGINLIEMLISQKLQKFWPQVEKFFKFTLVIGDYFTNVEIISFACYLIRSISIS